MQEPGPHRHRGRHERGSLLVFLQALPAKQVKLELHNDTLVHGTVEAVSNSSDFALTGAHCSPACPPCSRAPHPGPDMRRLQACASSRCRGPARTRPGCGSRAARCGRAARDARAWPPPMGAHGNVCACAQIRCIMMGDLNLRTAVQRFRAGQRAQQLLLRRETDAKRGEVGSIQGLRIGVRGSSGGDIDPDAPVGPQV